MKMPWLKLHADFYHDPKAQSMSEAMQRRFIMLLCLRCDGELKKLNEEEIRTALRISFKQWLKTKVLFISKGFIDSDLNLCNWEKRQSRYAAASEERRAPMTEEEKRQRKNEQQRQRRHEAKHEANEATHEANEATHEANEATHEASEATHEASEATHEASEATHEANEATHEAKGAASQPKKSSENLLKNQEITGCNPNPLDIDIDIDTDIDVDVDTDLRNLEATSKSIAPPIAQAPSSAPPVNGSLPGECSTPLDGSAVDDLKAASRKAARTYTAEFVLPAEATETALTPAEHARADQRVADPLPQDADHSTPLEPGHAQAMMSANPALAFDAAARDRAGTVWDRLTIQQRSAVLVQAGSKRAKHCQALAWRQFRPSSKQRLTCTLQAMGFMTADPIVDEAPSPVRTESAKKEPLAHDNEAGKGILHADPNNAKNDDLKTVCAKPEKPAPSVVQAEAVEEGSALMGKRGKKELTQAQKNLNATIWQRYSAAYFAKYGVTPLRNARVNKQINDVRERLGHEAPDVAAYYLEISDQWLNKTGHPIGQLLQGCEGYRMQWATGRKINSVTARQMENTQANVEAAKQAVHALDAGWVNPLDALMAYVDTYGNKTFNEIKALEAQR